MITDITQKEIKFRTRSQLGLKPEKLNFSDGSPSFNYHEVVKLDEYRQYWESLHEVRERFRTNVDFLRGRQLDGFVVDDDGNTLKESEYISAQGKTPFVQNIIRPVLRSIEGLFRQDAGKSLVVSRKDNSAQAEKMLTNALQSVLKTNETKEIDPRTLDYFLLSGLPCQRLGFDRIDEFDRRDIIIDYINPNYIFFNNDIADIRGKDLRLIGQLHDLTIEDVYVHFAKNDNDKKVLKRIFRPDTYETPNQSNLTRERMESLDFYVPMETHKCRVIEVWEKKAVDIIEYHDEIDGSEGEWKEGLEKLHEIANFRYDTYRNNGVPEDEIPRIHYKYIVAYKWFYKFLTPYGHVLRSGESPYMGSVHPFVLGAYPLISGEIWGFVEELLDIQKQYNRMFTHIDFLIGTSAKNTLVVDEASLNGKSPEEISSEYRRIGGVLVLKLKDGAKPPFELQNKGIDRAIFEIIKMFSELMQNISGVQPSLQGQSPGAGVPASRYMAETQNSIINLKGILDFFASFRRKRDMKALRMILQFYKSRRYLAISGDGNPEDKIYDPEMVKEEHGDLDLVVSHGMDSPVFKAVNDEMLKDMVTQGLIGIEQFLKHTDFPFSKPLLEDLQNTREQVTNGQQSPMDAVQQLGNKQNTPAA